MDRKRFSIRERIKSLDYALQGLGTFFITQHNAWIHLAAALSVILLGFYFQLDRNEWCWIVISIATVFITEMFNTAIEFLCDVVSPNLHPRIKSVKDVSAAAVLIAAMGAIAIGAFVFLPKFIGSGI
jgi:diacylglycerol kinase (ATP)